MTAAVRFAVVGTGFAGTCAFSHLVERLTGPDAPAVDVTILTVERRAVNGPGNPYATGETELAHRCNNQAATMAIRGNDFVDWMSARRRWLADHHPEMIRETHPDADPHTWRPDGDEFYPRALFGLYLEQRFRETADRARAHGIVVESHVRHEAVDGRSTPAGFAITVRDLDTGREFVVDRLDRVLLGTGHWQPAPPPELATHDGYVASPYPAAALRERVLARSRSRRRPAGVFVQGMGPSGIDAVLTLCGDGFSHTPDGHVSAHRPPDGELPLIVAGSRSGFFPPVRGATVTGALHHLTAEALESLRLDHGGHLRLDPVLALLDADLRRETGGRMGWSDVVSPPYASARDKLVDDLHGTVGEIVHSVVLRARRMRFYRHLAPEDKVRYDRSVDTHMIRTAVPMPRANGEKLLALLDAGVLSTVRLGYGDRDTVRPAGDGFRIGGTGPDGTPVELHADCLVRASAQDFSVRRHPSPLMANLLRRGEVVPHSEGGCVTGGIALHPGTYRVRRAGGTPGSSPHLASFGAPVRFWQNEHNYAGAFVEAAGAVADDWADVARAAAAGPALVGTDTGR